MKRLDSPLVALVVGAAGSAAANTAWTWQAGPVRVIAGLFTTALVPVAMHLWPQVPVTGWITRGLRFAAMSYICGAAAVVNLAHAVLLLTDHVNVRAEKLWLAVLSITAVEALMVMASLARRTPAVLPSYAVRPTAEAAGPAVLPTEPMPVPQDAAQDAPQDAAHATGPVPSYVLLGPSYAPSTAVLSRPIGSSYAGEGQDGSQDGGQGEPQCDDGRDAPQDGSDGAGQDAQDDPPNMEDDPLRWAVVELRAGRSAGYVVLRRRFPGLSERQAKDVARTARAEQDAGLHVVRTDGRTAVGQ